MNKINNNLIIKTITLAFIAFGIFIPINNTLANSHGYSYESTGQIIIPVIPPAPNNTVPNTNTNNITTNINSSTNTNTQTYINPTPTISQISPSKAPINTEVLTITVTGSKFMVGSIGRVNGENRTTNYVYEKINGVNRFKSTVLTMDLTKEDLSSGKPITITIFNPAPGGGDSNSITFNDREKNNSDLAAGAIFGSDGFMPRTFVQWLMLIILIAMGVILFRKATNKKEKYHSTPLKHD